MYIQFQYGKERRENTIIIEEKTAENFQNKTTIHSKLR